MNNENTVLSIVVPCYNEAETLPQTIEKLLAVLADLTASSIVSDSSFIYFIDDGSQDNTWEIVKSYHEKNERIKGVR